MDHIYLTENDNQLQPHMHEQLRDFIDEGFLTYNWDSTEGGQMKVVGDCVRNHYQDYDWLSFLDIDEFLVLRNQYATVQELCILVTRRTNCVLIHGIFANVHLQ